MTVVELRMSGDRIVKPGAAKSFLAARISTYERLVVTESGVISRKAWFRLTSVEYEDPRAPADSYYCLVATS